MDLSNLTADQANYMLRQGRATLADAQAFCAVWNRVKVSTEACAIEKLEYVKEARTILRVPRIVITDID